MDIIKSAKDLGTNIEKGVVQASNKVAKAIDNLASYLPFSNLAKKDDSSFHIEIDLPGVKKEDVALQVEDGVLIVSATRRYQNKLTKDDYYICESSFGKIQRHYILPSGIDIDSICAEFNNGRLEIELHQTQEAKPKQISVK